MQIGACRKVVNRVELGRDETVAYALPANTLTRRGGVCLTHRYLCTA